MIFVDVETTGSSLGDQFIEIGILARDGSILFHSLFDPGFPLPPRISNLTGIRNADVKGMPKFSDCAGKIAEVFDQNGSWCSWNVAFDSRFLLSVASPKRATCAMRLFSSRFPMVSAKLDSAAAHLGFSFNGKPHRAIADADMCRQVFVWLEEHMQNVSAGEILNNEQLLQVAAELIDVSAQIKILESEYHQQRERIVLFAKGQNLFVSGNGVSLRVSFTTLSPERIDSNIEKRLRKLPTSVLDELQQLGIVTSETRISFDQDKIEQIDPKLRISLLQKGILTETPLLRLANNDLQTWPDGIAEMVLAICPELREPNRVARVTVNQKK